jgi:hypothetical protein
MGRFSIRNIDWKAIGNAMIEVIRSIGRGDLILRMRVDKLFPYILYTFALAWASIWLSLKVEQTMLQVEKNKKTISELKITHAKKTYDLMKLNRLSTVESMLLEYGSEVKAPDKPADILR